MTVAAGALTTITTMPVPVIVPATGAMLMMCAELYIISSAVRNQSIVGEEIGLGRGGGFVSWGFVVVAVGGAFMGMSLRQRK